VLAAETRSNYPRLARGLAARPNNGGCYPKGQSVKSLVERPVFPGCLGFAQPLTEPFGAPTAKSAALWHLPAIKMLFFHRPNQVTWAIAIKHTAHYTRVAGRRLRAQRA